MLTASQTKYPHLKRLLNSFGLSRRKRHSNVIIVLRNGLHSQNNRITPPHCSLASRNVTSNNQRLPSHARVVICGAGAVANSVAYHLIQNGWKDIVVVEQKR